MVPSSRSGGKKDQLSALAQRIDLLDVWFALMRTKIKLRTFELEALSFPDFGRALKSAKKKKVSSG